MARAGHKVTVWAPAKPGHRGSALESGVQVHRNILRGPAAQTLTDPVAVAARATRCKLATFDVALVHHPTSFAGLRAVTRRLPLVYAFHASPFREARYERGASFDVRSRLRAMAIEPALKLLEREAARGARRILTLSEFSRQLIEADHPFAAERVRVVGGGVDVARFRPSSNRNALRAELGLPSSGLVMLTVRRLIPRMGIDTLLTATRLVLARGIPVQLEVVGSGPLDEDLRRLAENLGIGDVTRFRGSLPDEDVLRLYQAADVFVLPTKAYEGFGLATVEAMATGTPAIGTNAGATPEILRPFDESLVVDSDDHLALADAIEMFYRRNNTLEMRTRAREYVERNFSWSEVIRRWIKELENASRLTRAESTPGR